MPCVCRWETERANVTAVHCECALAGYDIFNETLLACDISFNYTDHGNSSSPEYVR